MPSGCLNSNMQLEHINSGGTTINQTSVTASTSTLGAVAFDSTGNVWAVGNLNNDLYEFNHIGTTISSGTSGGGINTPTRHRYRRARQRMDRQRRSTTPSASSPTAAQP